MPRIRTLTPEEAGGQAGAMLEDFKRTRGNIPNMYRTLSHRPEIATTLAAHQAAVMSRGTVANLLKEFVAVRVSQLNNCDY
jgi:alkylhydroperoxidase family enzyme